MIKAKAVEQEVYKDLMVYIDYFFFYWVCQVRSVEFSVYGLNHRTHNVIESFYTSLLEYLGVNTPLWTLYGKINNDNYFVIFNQK